MSEFIYDWTPNKQHPKDEIVRCRDCKWFMAYSSDTYCDRLASALPEVEPDGFCAWGVRKGASDDR